MKVNAIKDATQSLVQTLTAREKSQVSFLATLEAAKQNLVQTPEESPPTEPTERKEQISTASIAPKTAAEELAEYLRKTPAEHMRDAILKEMGLTEEDLDAMPPEQRAAVEQTIAAKIKELLQAQTGNKHNPEQPAVSILSLLT